MSKKRKILKSYLRNGAVCAWAYELSIKKLNSRSVLEVFEAMQYRSFYCLFRGQELWSLRELKELMDPLTPAFKVTLQYRNIQGEREAGTLITMMIDAIRQKDQLQGPRLV